MKIILITTLFIGAAIVAKAQQPSANHLPPIKTSETVNTVQRRVTVQAVPIKNAQDAMPVNTKSQNPPVKNTEQTINATSTTVKMNQVATQSTPSASGVASGKTNTGESKQKNK